MAPRNKAKKIVRKAHGSVNRTKQGYPITDMDVLTLLKWGGYGSVQRVTGVSYGAITQWITRKRDAGIAITLEDKRFKHSRTQVITQTIDADCPDYSKRGGNKLTL